MKLKGHSEFNLKLIKNKDGYFVEKSGGERLCHQCEKQASYHDLIKNEPIISQLFEVPKIVSHTCIDRTPFLFAMPFYNGKNILDVLERGDITLLDDLIDKLFMYLKWEFDNSYNTDSQRIIVDKLESLHNNISEIKLKRICLQLIDNMASFQTIPTGVCHGDFTFSNMIFSNKIILIDFLDSFIESPLQDVAKLLQEVRLKWTLLMDNPVNRDMTKINIGYEYLQDKIIDKISEEFPEYEEIIGIFYLITLLRIIPYTEKDTKIYKVLIDEIERSQI